MATQDTVVLHADSGTIARIRNGFVEVLRDGKELAKVRGRERLTLSSEGVLLIDGHCTLDLTARFPQSRKQLVLHAAITSPLACLHPDGDRVWGFRTGDGAEAGDGKPHKDAKVKGVYEASWEGTRPLKEPKVEPAKLTAGGKRKAVWDGKIDRPKAIALGSKAVLKAVGKLDDALLTVAEDGETWVVHTPDRLMVGTGDELRCNVQWSDGQFPFMTIDFENERVISTGKSGIAAVSFDGKVLAASGTADDRPLMSRAVSYNGEWVAVVCEHDGWNPRSEEYGDATYALHRYHATSVVPLGRLEAFSPYKTRGSLTPLVLADGTLAVVPSNEAEILKVASASAKPATKVTAAVTTEAMSPAARLLADLDDADAIIARLRADPGAFVEQADAVCAWDDKTLARAAKLLPDDFWVLTYGASDAAASDLTKAIVKGKKVDELRAKLLAGISSPIARMAVAELARKNKGLAALYGTIGIEVGDRIAAIERFARRSLELVAVEGVVKHDVRVITGTASPKLFVEAQGWSCKTELQHVVSVDTSALAGFPSMGWFHWFGSGCPEGCAEASLNYEYRVSPDGRLELVRGSDKPLAGETEPRLPSKQRCKGGKPEQSRIRHWALVAPDHAEAKRSSGTVGGRPQWLKKPQNPACSKCDRPMFYVGHVAAVGIRSHIDVGNLYGFWCEDCSHGIQVVQKS